LADGDILGRDGASSVLVFREGRLKTTTDRYIKSVKRRVSREQPRASDLRSKSTVQSLLSVDGRGVGRSDLDLSSDLVGSGLEGESGRSSDSGSGTFGARFEEGSGSTNDEGCG